MTTHAERMKKIDSFCGSNPHGSKHCYHGAIFSYDKPNAIIPGRCCWCPHAQPEPINPPHGPFIGTNT